MTNNLSKVRLKGNESFNFREGWLRKGVRCIEEHPDLFSRDDVMERLGVGSKMVKSIKYWLLATNLCREKIEKSGHKFYLTEDFGQIIDEHDKYFDDLSTLFFIHYQMISNDNLCMIWNIFFNEYSGKDFTKEDMVSSCKELLNRKMAEGATYSEKLLEDDCSSVLRMYLPSANTDDPEDSLSCPLGELGLLQKSAEKKGSYVKMAPSKGALDKLVVLYVMTKNLSEGRNSVSIDDLISAPNNIGRVFNLDRARVNEYLDELRVTGYLTINRTAGLDMVYFDHILEPSKIMEQYYKTVQEM